MGKFQDLVSERGYNLTSQRSVYIPTPEEKAQITRQNMGLGGAGNALSGGILGTGALYGQLKKEKEQERNNYLANLDTDSERWWVMSAEDAIKEMEDLEYDLDFSMGLYSAEDQERMKARYAGLQSLYGDNSKAAREAWKTRSSDLDEAVEFQKGLRQNERIQGWQNKYTGMSYYDLNKAIGKVTDPAEKAWLQQYAPTQMTEQDYSIALGDINTELYNLEKLAESLADDPLNQEAGRLQELGLESAADVNNRIEELKRQKWQLEHDREYRSIPQNEDFELMSQFTNSGVGADFRGVNQKQDARDVIAGILGVFPALYNTQYERMTEEEVKTFNYLYQTRGKDAAEEYIDYLKPQLDSRRTDEFTQSLTDFTGRNAGTAFLGNVASVPLNLLSGIGALDVGSQHFMQDITGEYRPINYNNPGMMLSKGTKAIRGTTADMITDATGTIQLDEKKHPVLSTILNGRGLADVYQLGMSAVDSRVAALTGDPVTATILLASSAATSGILDALERGATDEQALQMGMWNGAFEALFEFVEVKNLLKGDPNWVKAMTNQAITEGLGEGFTSVANNIADGIIMADKSALMQAAAEYEAQGLSEREAYRKAFADMMVDIGWDIIGGAASGGLSAGGYSVIGNEIGYRQTGKTIMDADGTAALRDLAAQVAGADTRAGKISDMVGDNATPRNVGRLYNEVNKTINSRNISEISQALQDAGVSKREANKIAGAYALDFNGIELTDTQRELLDSTMKDAKLAEAISGAVGQEAFARRNLSLDDFRFGLMQNAAQEATRTNPDGAPRDVAKAEGNSQERNIAAQSVSEDGRDHILSDPGKSVEVTGIASVDSGKVSVRLNDGGTAALEDVSFGDDGKAVVFSYFADMGKRSSGVLSGMSVNTMNEMIGLYDPSVNPDAFDFAAGAADAYFYGYEGIPQKKSIKGLTDAQQKIARNLGAMDGMNAARTAQEQIKKKGSETKGDRKGKLHFDRKGRKFTGARESSLKAMEALSEALGVDIYIFESYQENGKRVYKDRNGKVRTAPNGWYDTNTGAIHIDLNSGNFGQGTMMFTVAHELTHFIKQWSPEKFRTMANLLMEQYGKKGESVEDLIYDQIAKAKRNGRTISREVAFEEVVADSMEAMLTSGDPASFMADLQQKDKTLWEKVKNWLQTLVKKLQEVVTAYKGYKPDSNEGRMVAQMDDFIGVLQKAYGEALVDASENYRANEGKKNTTREGGVKYSFGVTQKDIDEYVDGAYAKTNTQDYKKYATVSEKLYNDVLSEIDIKDHSHALRDNDIRHIKNSHGEETNEKYPVTRQDIKNIPWIVENYDKVYVVRRSNGKTGLFYVKAVDHGIVYYLEQVTTKFGNEPLLINKQMIKTGITDIPGLPGLKDAITKKQSETEFLNDLKKAQQVYAQSVYQSHSKDTIHEPITDVNPESAVKLSDREYLAAVERGDIATAQRMVDEAAKRWGAFLNNAEANEVFKQSGEVRIFYHGTNTGDFTVFDKSLLGNSSGDLGWFGKGFYFAFSSQEAASYGGRVINVYLKMSKPYDYSQLYKFKGSENVSSRYSRFAWLYNIVDQFPDIANGQKVYAYPNDAEDGSVVSWKQLAKWMDRIERDVKFSVEQVETPYGETAWELRADPKQESFTNADGETFTWTEYGMRQQFTTEKEAKAPINQIGAYLSNVMGVETIPRRSIEKIDFSGAVQRAGYDGIIQSPSGDEAVVFDPSQIKSSDPVTYGDDGKVIPLSERFDTTKADIRYSDRDPIAADMTPRALLANALESVAQNDIERRNLEEYQGKIEQLNKQEARLAELNEEIKELSFSKGPRDKAKLSALRDEKIKTQNRINVLDKSLLRMEAAKPLQRIVEVERGKVAQRERQKAQKALDAQRSRSEAKYAGVLREQRETRAALTQKQSDYTVIEREFLRLAKEFERANKVSERNINELRDELKAEAKRHDKDRGAWEREFARLMNEYERADTKVAALEAKIEAQTKTAKARVDSRKRTAVREKIRKVVHDIDTILNRGTKKRNVKEGMRDVAQSLLYSAEVFFTDQYSVDDMLLNGIGVIVPREQQQKINRARAILEALNTPEPDISTLQPGQIQAMQDEERALRKELTQLKRELRDVFEAERFRLEEATAKAALQDLCDKYLELKDAKDSYISAAFNQEVYDYLVELRNSLGAVRAKDMSLEQLERVYDAYKMVLTTIRNANKLFAADVKETRDQLAARTMIEVSMAGRNQKRGKLAKAANSFAWNNLKPVYAFEKLGSETMQMLYGNIRKGQDTWAVDMTEANAFRRESEKKHGFDNWDMDKTYTFSTSSGKTFNLNLQQIMSIYAYSKREQAHDHLLKGGIVFEGTEVTEVDEKGRKRTYINEDATAYGITDEALTEIIGKLTAEQRSYVDEMQTYLSATMGDKGNEVSMKLYGVRLFKEANYFPLRSAGQYQAKTREANLQREQGQVSIVNSGFTKSVTPKASNPVVLSEFGKTWASHVNEMSMYHAFVLPMEDFRRVYNYSTPHTEEGDSASVNEAIQNSFGTAATDYIDQLYRDLNGGAVSDPRESIAKRMVGLFKKGAVMASASVVLQQPSSIGRAFAMIDPKYFGVLPIARGTVRAVAGAVKLSDRHNRLWAELKKYAPVAMIKEMGYFDTGMGRSAVDFLQSREYSGLREKATAIIKDSDYRDEVLSRPAAVADELAWIQIWEAVKNETAAKFPSMDRGSEGFLKAAGQRFSEVIDRTQVYDSVLSRSANMRSKSLFMNMATSFMAEPTTAANMVEDALRKGAKGQKVLAAKTIGAVFVSIVINAALSSIIYAMRDDDEDETMAEKYISRFVTEMLDGINPITYFPFLKDVWSILQGFDVERADMSIISDLTDILQQMVKLAATDTSTMGEEALAAHRNKVCGAWMSAADAMANLVGIPFKNVRRDINAVINTWKNLTGSDMKMTALSLSDVVGSDVKDSLPVLGWLQDETKAERLLDAILAGDTVYADRIMGSYKNENSVHSAIRTEIKKRYISGEVSYEEAIRMLVEYGGMESEDDAYWKLDEWDHDKTEGQDADYSKYDRFFQAVETGKDLRAVITEYTQKGIDGDALRTQLTKHFKPIYTEMSVSGRAGMKGYLLNAMELCGQDRSKAEISLKKWDFEAAYGYSWDDRGDAYKQGAITADQLIAEMMKITGKAKEEASLEVQVYDWQKEIPNCEITASGIEDYNVGLNGSGISKEVYYDAWTFYRETSGEVDADGKSIPYSKCEKVMPYINSLPLTAAQKTAIARLWWAESAVKKYKLW